MKIHEHVQVRGQCRATMIATDDDGREIPISEALSDASKAYLEAHGLTLQRQMHDHNLVVNGGREALAKLLGGEINDEINRLVLGDLGSGVTKSEAKPQLTDQSLYHVIRTLNDAPQGTFLLDSDTDFTYPQAAARYPSDPDVDWAPTTCTVEITGAETVLTDPNLSGDDFSTLGVQLTDQVTLDTNTANPLVVGIKEVRSANELVLHNPRQYETPTATEVRYSVDAPGTQLLISRLVTGDSFDEDTWGPAVMVKEAGLLTNNDRLFNRVIFAPSNDDYGMLLQPSSQGNELSIRFEWLLTF